MKRLFWLSCIFLFLPIVSWAGSNPYVLGGGISTVAVCAGVDSDFGSVTPTAAWDCGDGGYVFWNNGTTSVFTAPGSGTVQICTMQAYVKTSGVGNISIGVYDSAGTTKICELTEPVAVVSSTGDWYGATYGGFTGTCTLTGGSEYMLAVWYSHNDLCLNYTVESGTTNYKSGTDYSADWPSALPTPGTPNSTYKVTVKVGVQ